MHAHTHTTTQPLYWVSCMQLVLEGKKVLTFKRFRYKNTWFSLYVSVRCRKCNWWSIQVMHLYQHYRVIYTKKALVLYPFFLHCDDDGGIWSVGMLLIVVHKLAKGIFHRLNIKVCIFVRVCNLSRNSKIQGSRIRNISLCYAYATKRYQKNFYRSFR